MISRHVFHGIRSRMSSGATSLNPREFKGEREFSEAKAPSADGSSVCRILHRCGVMCRLNRERLLGMTNEQPSLVCVLDQPEIYVTIVRYSG